MIDIKTLVDSIDLVDLVERESGASLERAGCEWRGACPIHAGHNKTGFSIYTGSDHKQRWTCFTGDCGSGDAIDFIKAFRRVDFAEACRLLGGQNADPELIRRLADERVKKAEADLAAARARLDIALTDLRSAKVWERYYNNLETMGKRYLWELRGIPSVWQDQWQLGYNPCFQLYKKNDQGGFDRYCQSESISIPIFAPGWKAMTVRHRLISEGLPDDVGKYHPERAGLASYPFVCDPDMPIIGEKGVVAVIEGEIKAQVFYITLDDIRMQVLGVAGKKGWKETADMIREAERVYILFDPDADARALAFARDVGDERARLARLHGKVDDLILDGQLDKRALRTLLNNAVHPDYF